MFHVEQTRDGNVHQARRLSRWRSAHCQATCLCLMLLAGCGGLMDGSSTSAKKSTGSETIFTVATSKAPLAAVPYRSQVAHSIVQQHADKVFTGVPPNPLFAIIVLQFEVAPNGKLQNLKTLRAPTHAPQEHQIALNTVYKTALPVPPTGKTVMLTETWLFNEKQQFQLRTLAEPQAAE